MTRSHTRIASAVLGAALLGLVGCQSAPRGGVGCGVLPTDLPPDPLPCTTYCRVWVPPVYRNVPRLVMVSPPRTQVTPETVMRTRFRDVCVKPAEQRVCQTPDLRCDQAVVQVKPGGYVWKRVPGPGGADCWKYCYEPGCYQWCNKVVTERGIQYCTEIPPKYMTEAWSEPVTRCREEYVPGTYRVQWVKELYTPGYWAWKPSENCAECECPAPCPVIPCKKQPCEAVGLSVPRTN